MVPGQRKECQIKSGGNSLNRASRNGVWSKGYNKSYFSEVMLPVGLRAERYGERRVGRGIGNEMVRVGPDI